MLWFHSEANRDCRIEAQPRVSRPKGLVKRGAKYAGALRVLSRDCDI
jgi:hypothetical protein